MRRITTGAVLLILATGGAITGRRQIPPIEDLMQRKLGHAQKILEAIATANFTELTERAAALGVLSEASEWTVLQTPDYSRHSGNFRRATDSLAEAGEDRNVDAAALAYVEMVLVCVQCHKYVRGARMASRPVPEIPLPSPTGRR